MNLAEMMQIPQDWNRDRFHDMQTTLDAPCPLLCRVCHGTLNAPCPDDTDGDCAWCSKPNRYHPCFHPDTPTWADVINAGIAALT